MTEDDLELRALLAESAPPVPSSALDARLHALLRPAPLWRRLLFGGIQVPVPVLAMLLLLLAWALLRNPAESRPAAPPFSVMTIENRGYVPVTNPTVSIRRGGDQEQQRQ